MVKIGALIGAFFVTIGAFLQIVVFSPVASGERTWREFETAANIAGGSAQDLVVSSIFVFFFGIILVLGSGFVKGKLFLVIGGGIMIIGYFTMMISMLTGNLYEDGFIAGSFMMVLGVILYFVGCIHFRKHNIIAVITGFLLMIAVFCAELIFGFLVPFSNGGSDITIRMHFINLIIQAVIFIIHSWVFGFSKKRVEYSDKVEDTLSIEKGQAFASYVPSDMKKKKGKKPSEDDEITFTF